MANESSVPLHWQAQQGGKGGSRIPEAGFGVKAQLKLKTPLAIGFNA